MMTKINSEFEFSKKTEDNNHVSLTLYINYVDKTYDFTQPDEDGIFPRNYNGSTKINKAYFELGLEILDFVEKELFSIKEDLK